MSQEDKNAQVILSYNATEGFHAAIDEIVEKQEGGWILAHSANDPDGGWTFCGITATNWTAWWNKKNTATVLSSGTLRKMIEIDIAQHCLPNWQARAKQLYFEEFYIAGQHAVQQVSAVHDLNYKPALDGDPALWVLSPAELSCIINLGPTHFADVFAKTFGPSGYEPEKFLQAWEDWYIQNTIQAAYRAYQLALHGTASPVDIGKLHFLQGWINRVRYWVGRH